MDHITLEQSVVIVACAMSQVQGVNDISPVPSAAHVAITSTTYVSGNIFVSTTHKLTCNYITLLNTYTNTHPYNPAALLYKSSTLQPGLKETYLDKHYACFPVLHALTTLRMKVTLFIGRSISGQPDYRAAYV